MKALHGISFVLLVIGGLNWLLVGLLGKDLFAYLNMGMTDMLPKVVYILVGLSAVYLIIDHKNSCKYCAKQSIPGQSNM